MEFLFYLFVLDALQKLVGEKNAQKGTIKLFDTLQNKKLNKHFIFVSKNHIF